MNAAKLPTVTLVHADAVQHFIQQVVGARGVLRSHVASTLAAASGAEESPLPRTSRASVRALILPSMMRQPAGESHCASSLHEVPTPVESAEGNDALAAARN
jgi:NH3-dependent NAD+ synthetase